MRSEGEIRRKVQELTAIISPGHPRYESGETKGFFSATVRLEVEVLRWVLGEAERLPFE